MHSKFFQYFQDYPIRILSIFPPVRKNVTIDWTGKCTGKAKGYGQKDIKEVWLSA